MAEAPRNTAFLTVADAAERLGTSRLRVREAVARGLIEARRDNEGRLRVDLPDSLRLPQAGKAELAPDAVLSFLFDDIEELEAALADRDTRIAMLALLIERQDAALQAADAALTDAETQAAGAGAARDAAEARATQLSDLLDRALAHLMPSLGSDLSQLIGKGQLAVAETNLLERRRSQLPQVSGAQLSRVR